jgi:2-succinyl-5-enolpyruvyl-6-hydroxy-3-cyclohexene-1-carboxylate synthase
MLPHEDEGMMGQFLVLNPDQFPVPNPLIELSVYPSPAKSKTTVRVGFGTPTDFRLEVISIATGRCMFAQEANVAHLKTELDLLTYPKGMFVVRVSTARRSYHQWLIKE